MASVDQDFDQCSALRPASFGFYLKLKVVESMVIVDKTRLDGSRVRVAEGVIGDASASVIFTARDDQVDLLVPGNTLELLNAKVEMYEGWMRLEVDRWGDVKAASEPLTDEVNLLDNLSYIEYELVDRPA
eukprot:TRINITY_DN6193_c0_g1_i1.p1 TRINITY_DN6193_c0_g1~~TRINITY_DN6193_c0_g1_i1.p1  ORF type:complete len:130 (+),score=16.66 TRINITY_DN6193_c0_g1_i1:2-391(+)